MPEGSKRIQTVSGIVLLIVVVMLIGVYYLWLVAREDEPVMNTTLVQVPQREAADTGAEAEAAGQATLYSSLEHGFGVEYPVGWDIETLQTGDGDSSISTVRFSGGDETVDIIITDQGMEGIIANSISIDAESEIAVSGQRARLLEGGNMKDGSPLNMVLLVNGDTLYAITGLGDSFNSIVEHFSLQ